MGESIKRSKTLMAGLVRRLKIYQAIEDVLGSDTHTILKEAARNASKRVDLERRRIDCILAAQGK